MSSPGSAKDSPFRLVIVDDSPSYRLRFAKLFGRSGRITVVGMASDGEEGIRMIADERPDVVILDLNMPRLDGFAVLRWAMSSLPVPIIVCSTRRDRESIFKALELGAVDYITKPESARDGFKGIEPLLVERVEAAARARLDMPGRRPAPAVPLDPDLGNRPPAQIFAIAASTGGPSAIQRLISALPKELTVPIVIVQHMPPGFTRLFAERLERLTHYQVVEAYDGAGLTRGTIYVAPGGMQTTLSRIGSGVQFSVVPRQPSDPHAPSADLLFASVAEAFGPGAVAVTLTGMGDDGSRGVVAIKERGGYVIAETSDSALIYGMPRAVVATGCADAQLPLTRMPEALHAIASPPKK